MKLLQIFLAMFLGASALALNNVDQAYLATPGKNWVKNGGAENARQGWATYSDSAGVAPVDCTSGSPSSTWTVTSTTPLAGTNSFLWTHSANNRQGEGVSYAFSVDKAEQGKLQTIAFDYEVASGTFVAGVVPIGGATAVESDLEVYVYDVTNSLLIQPSNFRLLGNSGQQRFVGTFQTASNSQSYRLCLHAATTSTSAHTVKVDSVKVGPGYQALAAAISDWTDMATPGSGWFVTGPTASSSVVKGRRVGDSLEIYYYFRNFSSTWSSVEVRMPAGLTVDTNKLSVLFDNSNRQLWGHGSYGSSVANPYAVRGVSNATNNTFLLRAFANPSSTTVQVTEELTNSLVAAAASSYLTFHVVVPVAGWATNVTALTSSADTRVITAMMYRGSSNQSLSNNTDTKIQLNTVVFDTLGTWDASNNRWVAPVPGYYQVTGQVRYTAAANNQRDVSIVVNGSSTPLFSSMIGSNTAANWVQANGVIKLAAGDTVQLNGTQNSGGALDVNTGQNNTYLSIAKMVGPDQLGPMDTIAAAFHVSGAQSINGAAKITFAAADKIFDTTGMFDDANDRLVVPIAGTYQVCGTWRTATGTTNVGGSFRKTGVSGDNIGASTANSGNITVFSGCQMYRAIAGDYFELWATSGSAINFQDNKLSVHRIGN